MVLKHNLFDLRIKVVGRVDTHYCDGTVKSNYLCENILPACYEVDRPIRTICDRDYIETDYHEEKQHGN